METGDTPTPPRPAAAGRGPLRIVVAGGGVAGLAAAHRVLELAREAGVEVALTLCEARGRLGGIVATERAEGYVIEAGPDAFLTEKPWALALCERLGIGGRLIGTRPGRRRTYVVCERRLRPLPEGFALIAPTRWGPLLRSGLFTWRGKVRMALDLVLPRRAADGDESLASFVTRRLGREVLDRVAQPMVAGIYTADPETLSLGATMPRFLEMERRHRSVILGLRHARAGARSAADRNPDHGNGGRPDRGVDDQSAGEGGERTGESAGSGGAAALPGDTGSGHSRVHGGRPRGGGAPEREGNGPRWSLFAAPAGGMGALVEALASRLRGQEVRTGTAVRAVVPGGNAAPDGARYRVALDDGTVLAADGVIVAAEACHAAPLLRDLDADLAGVLSAIPYASSAIVTLAYRREQIAHPLDGFGFVVPRAEGLPILACTFSSVKFEGRAPEGRVLLRAFLGGALRAEDLERDDDALVASAAGPLAALLGITGPPEVVRVHRHHEAMPQYLVGHLDRVAEIEGRAAAHPALALAGGAYRGVGIPDCIRSGEAAAEQVLRDCVGS